MVFSIANIQFVCNAFKFCLNLLSILKGHTFYTMASFNNRRSKFHTKGKNNNLISLTFCGTKYAKKSTAKYNDTIMIE